MKYGGICKCGREKRGENLLIINRSNGSKTALCRACHNRRQMEYHWRKKAKKEQAA